MWDLALVSATLLPFAETNPMWTPRRAWLDDGGDLHIYDEARACTDRVELDLQAGTASFGQEKAGEWWSLRATAVVRKTVEELLSDQDTDRFEVGALARGPGGCSVVAVNDVQEEFAPELVLLDDAGVVQILRLDRRDSVHVADICFVSPDRFVVVDDYLHVVHCFDLSGALVWRRGTPGEPNGDGLVSPIGCCVLDGRIVVVSRLASHIVVFDFDGAPLDPVYSRQVKLRSAASIAPLDAHRAVVIDAYAGTLHLLTTTTPWQVTVLAHERQTPTTGPLSFPRAVVADGGELFLADTNNRQVLRRGAGAEWTQLRFPGWPRSVALNGQEILVADGLAGTILRCTERPQAGNEEAWQELHLVTDAGDPLELADPHHLEPAADGDHVWVVDSSRNDVLLVGLNGEVRWQWCRSELGSRFPLSDPHQAVVVPGSPELLVVDSLNHRILRANPGLESCVVVVGDGCPSATVYPRFVVRVGGHWLLSEQGGALSLLDDSWRRVAELAVCLENSPLRIPQVEPPRALFADAGRILIPDYSRGVVYVAARADCEAVL